MMMKCENKDINMRYCILYTQLAWFSVFSLQKWEVLIQQYPSFHLSSFFSQIALSLGQKIRPCKSSGYVIHKGFWQSIAVYKIDQVA